VTTRRKLLIGASIVVVALGVVVYQGVRSSMVYYLTPTEFRDRPEIRHQTVRLAGRVVPGSVARAEGIARFEITDGITPYRVRYTGPLPDLFAEGREVLVEGRLDDAGVLQATQVISTHPPEYRAPER
jgi:cytochrome c-type biogenesis protein CcmE